MYRKTYYKIIAEPRDIGISPVFVFADKNVLIETFSAISGNFIQPLYPLCSHIARSVQKKYEWNYFPVLPAVVGTIHYKNGTVRNWYVYHHIITNKEIRRINRQVNQTP